MRERITPETISSLGNDEVFVFGSNLAGRHGKGAARNALKFGAIYGMGCGYNKNSYAIPTKDGRLHVLPIDVIKIYVDAFIAFAAEHPQLSFYVTKIGCGLAGYRCDEIAPLLFPATKLKNVYLPGEFWNVLENGVDQ